MTETAQGTRRKLIAGNWKMNGLLADARALVTAIAEWTAAKKPPCDVLICPPATLLSTALEIVSNSNVKVGGQDCHAGTAGAYTGEVSAIMLKDLGCSAVIVGHSERRANYGETDSQVHAKAKAALESGLNPIVCVGETEAERLSGHALSVVCSQVSASVPEASADRITVAYEPVWAIGTGRTPTSHEIVEMHAAIRRTLEDRVLGGEAVRILYGGSVKASNAKEVLALEGIDGALVGGASLKAEEFCSIIEATR